jgi:Ankyrin repeats (3 copies)
MPPPTAPLDVAPADAIRRILNGDFSWADPLFITDPASGRPTCRIVEWIERGEFENQPKALAEALSCACFSGRTDVARYLLDRGVDPAAGNGTGLNAVHWAANRGQLETVKLLLERKAPLELRNMYGGTVLCSAVWSAVNEPKPDHIRIIEALLEAGADVREAEYPSGSDAVDAVLRRFGAITA